MKRLPVLVCFICVASFPKHVIGRIGKELASAYRSMANDTPRELDEIKALGFGILRYGIMWRYVEDNPGSYVWTKYDNSLYDNS
jgi:hypothetical protein